MKLIWNSASSSSPCPDVQWHTKISVDQTHFLGAFCSRPRTHWKEPWANEVQHVAFNPTKTPRIHYSVTCNSIHNLAHTFIYHCIDTLYFQGCSVYSGMQAS